MADASRDPTATDESTPRTDEGESTPRTDEGESTPRTDEGESTPGTGEGEPTARTDDGRTIEEMTAGTGGETVELTSLRKRFGAETAVEDVSLSVAEGELVVLLGPSGCGKTTTLRMIAGLESVSGGSVAIGGEDVSQSAPQDRDVAMVFQNYALYPHKTVRENIRFPLRKTDLSTAEQTERIESTAALLDIDDLLGKQPAALSGGQRQRVAIGRAIAREPSVLLMDEPLSNLDAKLRVRTRSELRSLQQRLGITTVYVTHDQEEAMSIADRIAIMNDGGIEQVGTPEEVYEDPASAFIADFLGDPSMNILPTDAAGSAGDAGAATDGSDRGGLAAALAAAVPEAATRVGVRPEDCYLADDEGRVVGTEEPRSASAVHDCQLTVVEPIGRAYELTIETEAGPVVVRVRAVPDEFRGRERVGVAFDRDALYAFDADGGRVRW